MNTPITRVATYTRYSSDRQTGNTSIPVQMDLIKAWVARQPNAVIVQTYSDEAKSGRNVLKRDALKELQADALAGKFDAVCVALFDRLGRNATETRAVKSFLRDDCRVKVYSATETGEDDENGGMLFEGITDLMSEDYSLKLSQKFKRGKRSQWQDGWFIGSKRPYGYEIVAVTLGRDKYNHAITRNTLKIIPHEAEIVRETFESYVKGTLSTRDIANRLNEQGHLTPLGYKFKPATINDLMRNPVYAGILWHRESRSNRAGTIRYFDLPLEKIKGRHEPIISEDLFNRVQEMKGYRKAVKHGTHEYLLQGSCWCWECFQNAHKAVGDGEFFGKMHCHTQTNKQGRVYSHYVCTSRQKGYDCSQSKTQAASIDKQVVWLLSNLQLPTDWKKRIVTTIANDMRDTSITDRINEIKGIVERLDKMYLFDGGRLMTEAIYLAQRTELMNEYDKLSPAVNTDMLAEAADLLANFKGHFEGKSTLEQNKLIRRIIDRVFVSGKEVVAIQFHNEAHTLLHLGGDVARFFDTKTGEEWLIDKLTDERLQTYDGTNTKLQAEWEENLQIEALREKYPNATPEEITCLFTGAD